MTSTRMFWTTFWVVIFFLLAILFAAFMTLMIQHAKAHEIWANGEQVPKWIRSACCGQADAHVLGPDEYWIDAHGFHVVGIDQTVPIDKVLPSQDGKVWAFYTVRSKNAVIHCVFYSGSI